MLVGVGVRFGVDFRLDSDLSLLVLFFRRLIAIAITATHTKQVRERRTRTTHTQEEERVWAWQDGYTRMAWHVPIARVVLSPLVGCQAMRIVGVRHGNPPHHQDQMAA